MAFWQWMGLAVAAAALCMTVRVWQPQMAGLISAAAGLILLLGALESIQDVQAAFTRLERLGGLQEGYLEILLKVLGVSYVAELAGQVCTDLGERGLSLKVELAGKLCVFSMTAPMLLKLLELILELTP